jgi:hypothetical protein
MALTNYTKKPPVVQAVRWGEDGCKEALAEMQGGKAVKERVHPEDSKLLQVETARGYVPVQDGDYLVLEGGEWRKMSAEEFESQYAPEQK